MEGFEQNLKRLVVEEDAYGDLRYLPGLAFHPKNHTTYSFLLQKLQSRDDKAKEVEAVKKTKKDN